MKDNMKLIKDFKEISKLDVSIAGGKGASLGEMTQAGIPVPVGFVILADVFDKFLREIDLNIEIDAALDDVNVKKVHTIEKASEKIQAMILSKEMSDGIKEEVFKNFKKLDAKFVAVRSSATSEDSATAAWAGQLDSFLNITEETLLENIKKCWASLFTPRAIFYRFEKELNNETISVAVVVQKMVDSEESGIVFSVHPVTQDENQIIIEASFGLGEAIVSGIITPDSYVVDKQGFKILDINVNEQVKALYSKGKGGNEWKELREKGKKQVLSKKEIIELSKLIVEIENHYGFPVDIEWAKERGKFYIVQSRPITTLTGFKKTKKVFTKEHSREYSFFRLASWYNSMSQGMKKIIGDGITEACAVYRGGDLVSIYYESTELKRVFGNIMKKCEEKEYVRKEIQKFLNLSDRLKEYYTGKKKIENLKQLRKFQELYALVWAYTAIIFVIPTFPVDKELKKFALKAREKTQEYNETPEIIFIEVLERFYPKLKKKTRFILPEEVWSGEIKKEDFISKIVDREKGFIYYKEEVYTGNLEENLDTLGIKLEDKKSAVSGKAIVNKNQIKGQIAYKGKVTGKVKIVSNIRDLSKVGCRDILVAAMTMPKYLSAMKKAKGFITDEGGITCHAAIVAREMKKPCIIGTKVATQILKDGMEVEVDANKGVIKILKQANK